VWEKPWATVGIRAIPVAECGHERVFLDPYPSQVCRQRHDHERDDADDIGQGDPQPSENSNAPV
jgi:hypothetical protein